MLDAGDLVKCKPDVHAGLKGRIKDADYDCNAEVVVELENSWIIVLKQVGGECMREGRLRGLSGPFRNIA